MKRCSTPRDFKAFATSLPPCSAMAGSLLAEQPAEGYHRLARVAKLAKAAALKAAAPSGACGFESRPGHLFEPVISEQAKQFLSERSGRSSLGPAFPKIGTGGISTWAVAKNIDRAAGVPDPPRAKRQVRRVTAEEQIAQRVLNRQRDAVILFLREARLRHEMRELADIEARLAEANDHACKHAAYSARNLMEGVANRLFPPRPEKWRDRDGRTHSLRAKDFKNRLIAYAEWTLEGSWEPHELRAFVATMDTVCRWTGSGPHGAYRWAQAERAYLRMLDALAILAHAFGRASRQQ